MVKVVPLPGALANSMSPPVVLHDAIASGETQTGSDTDTFGSKPGIEHLLLVFRWYADASIRDGDGNLVSFRDRSNRDGSPFFNGTRRVEQKIHEHLVHPIGITVDERELPVFFDDLDPLSQLVLQQR